MKRVVYGLLFALLIAAFVAGGCGEPDRLKQDLDRVAEEVVEIRGLSPKGEVPYQFVTTAELRERLISDLEEDYPLEQMRIDQEVYVLLDLMTADQDLHAILLDVYSEQVIGFYDDEAGELYVVSDREELGPLEKVVFAHEYTHALQDQYFDLSSLPLDDEDNSDLALASISLVEGDASLVQTSYMFGHLSRDDLRALIQESQESETEMLEAAPRFVRETLTFPYIEGLRFVSALGGGEDILQAYANIVLGLGVWDDIDQAYGDLPQSTEQILHPEKYLERDEPQDVIIPDLEGIPGPWWTPVRSDVLGEFGMRTYLETFVAQHTAESAAEGWDGDRYVYLLDRMEGEQLLVLRCTWDSEKDATEF
ncbi:MAG: hypothetical protein V3S51_04655, partial [Dehalococcoidia bacterium]